MNKIIRATATLTAAACALLAIQACSKAEKTEEPTTLKIWSWEGTFGEYASDYAAERPNVRLVRIAPPDETNPPNGYDPEAIRARFEQALRTIEETQPDVLLLDLKQYALLSKSGKLASLESRVQEKEFDAASYSPAALSMLRAQGDGQLYGLSDNLYGEASYYNKTLLAKSGLSVPENPMSWEETLALAGRVTASQADKAGYFAGTGEETRAWTLISNIGLSSGLHYASMGDKKVTIHTPAWTKIWERVLEGYKTGAIVENTQKMSINRGGHQYYKPEDSYGPFLKGEAAMIRQGPGFQTILDASELKFEWGVAPEPVDPAIREGVSLQPSNLYAINAASSNQEEAWRLIRYLTGEERLKKQASAIAARGGIPVRPEADVRGPAFVRAFTELPPSPNGQFVEFYREDIPVAFADRFYELANACFLELLGGSGSVDEALGRLQNEAQAALATSLSGGKGEGNP